MQIVLSALFMGDTAFILNSICEATGYYLWFLPKISFITDAFPLLGPAVAVRSDDDYSGGPTNVDVVSTLHIKPLTMHPLKNLSGSALPPMLEPPLHRFTPPQYHP